MGPKALITPIIEILTLLILLPLLWGAIAFIVPQRFASTIAVVALAIQLLLAILLNNYYTTPLLHAVGGWSAPLGIELMLDGLSVAMILLTQLLLLPLAIYAASWHRASATSAQTLWPLVGLLNSGLNGLFLSGDLFNQYVTLEIIGLSAVALVALGGGARQITAALRYLFATLAASTAWLLGVALIYGTYGNVTLSLLTPAIASSAPLTASIALGLMLIGMVVKSALVPFHTWLPPAHGSATPAVSALLSALVVKASFYLFLRLWIGPFAPLIDPVAWIPATLGTAAIFWGSWRAIYAQQLKELIAYSTVAQLGYLFLIFPLIADGGVAAGMMQLYAHALAKAALFTAAGTIILATGEYGIKAALAGSVVRLPITIFALAIASVTLMGLPPSAGFLAKWQLIAAALASGYWNLAIVILSGGLLAAIYLFRILRLAFVTPDHPTTTRPIPAILEWISLLLALASLLLGLRGVELVMLVGSIYGAPQ
jgi:multicomponent Na+:H+ antiporter subunit D